MRNTVAYLVSSLNQLPLLTCSIYSLRRWWYGDIAVFCLGETVGIVSMMAKDKRLSFYYIPWSKQYKGVGEYDLCRNSIVSSLDDYSTVLSMPNNTIVRGDINPLFDRARIGFLATRNNQLTVSDIGFKKTIESFKLTNTNHQSVVFDAINQNKPALDSDIFACHPKSKVLDHWSGLLARYIEIEGAANVTLQLVLGLYESEGCAAVMSGLWNCSPDVTDLGSTDDVIIWNFKNGINLFPNKYPKVTFLWMPLWESCLTTNVGFINEWLSQCDSLIPKQWRTVR